MIFHSTHISGRKSWYCVLVQTKTDACGTCLALIHARMVTICLSFMKRAVRRWISDCETVWGIIGRLEAVLKMLARLTDSQLVAYEICPNNNPGWRDDIIESTKIAAHHRTRLYQTVRDSETDTLPYWLATRGFAPGTRVRHCRINVYAYGVLDFLFAVFLTRGNDHRIATSSCCLAHTQSSSKTSHFALPVDGCWVCQARNGNKYTAVMPQWMCLSSLCIQVDAVLFMPRVVRSCCRRSTVLEPGVPCSNILSQGWSTLS